MMPKIEDLWFIAEDGLKLHALTAGRAGSDHLPVICLPGISRTAEDFQDLLEAFAADITRPRRIIALDSRGRGLSERDKNPANYSVGIELRDLLTLIRKEKIERSIFIGTSRGGILAMVLAAILPQAIAGTVLNDIGPVIEMEGLLRIKSYVGKIAQPKSWDEAVASLRNIMGASFPAFHENDWKQYARRTWHDDFEPRSDPAISAALAEVDPKNPPPPLWPQFAMLAASPVLVIRGEHSDLLSRDTVTEMEKRGADVASIEVPGQGHAPALDGVIVKNILDFAAKCDARRAGPVKQ